MHIVDIEVGKRIRYRRWRLGISQKELAAKVGVGFQQVQKYETGTNRVSASRLFLISKALSVPISYFFEDVDEKFGQRNDSCGDGLHPAKSLTAM